MVNNDDFCGSNTMAINTNHNKSVTDRRRGANVASAGHIRYFSVPYTGDSSTC